MINSAIASKGSNLGEHLTTNGECRRFFGQVNDHTWEVAELEKCNDNANFTLTLNDKASGPMHALSDSQALDGSCSLHATSCSCS